MEACLAQKYSLKPKLIRIKIEEYEKDIETPSSKEKKKEILDLFTNFNNLHSEDELYIIEKYLHEACQKGDLDLIKILLCETIENESKELTFKIDKTNQTASLFKVNNKSDNIVIPRTVKHESVDYLITSIFNLSDCYSLKTIKFSEDSAVKTIYKFSFKNIKEVYFPESLRELKEEWCSYTEKLKKIVISPSNKYFKFDDNKYLLGKSDPNNDEFDILLFASRKIKEIIIPSNIKIISSYAFQFCKYLAKVEFQNNSNLQTIERFGFSSTYIDKIFIPSKVSKICKSAFSECYNLSKVKIPTNSNLQTIEKSAFQFSNIHDIYFPERLKELKEGWCNKIERLKKIVISPSNKYFKFDDNKYLLGKSDPNNDEFDILLFASRDIKEIIIPSNIKIIASYAFNRCKYLAKVEFQANSNLQTIERFAFSSSNIEEIFIPSKVSTIDENAFSECFKLIKVDISSNSNLQVIERSSFSFSKTKEIYFPVSLKELKEGWCNETKNLEKIIISPSNKQFKFNNNNYLLGKNDLNNDEFDILLFVSRKIKEIIIPSNIKIISSYAFQYCMKLEKVEISTNSNLQTIERSAFSFSYINEVFIPSKVSKICESAFQFCRNLIKVEIPANSNLQTIERSAFAHSSVKNIFIPSKVSTICKDAFAYCKYLQIIEISEESELESFPLSAFRECSKAIIMIPSSSVKFI